MKKILRMIISIPKTIYYNFFFLRFKDAIKLPLLIGYDCKIIRKKGTIKINPKCSIKPFMIKIGYTKGSFNLAEGKKTYIEINKNCTLVFQGNAIISKGSYICLNNNSIITLGNNFSCNSNCIISSQNSITFGDSCLIGWDCTIIDDDGHKTSNSEKKEKGITVGEHVWIAAKTSVLKGSKIGDGSIIGYGAIVSGDYSQKNILIASQKAEKKRDNIDWQK